MRFKLNTTVLSTSQRMDCMNRHREYIYVCIWLSECLFNTIVAL